MNNNYGVVIPKSKNTENSNESKSVNRITINRRMDKLETEIDKTLHNNYEEKIKKSLEKKEKITTEKHFEEIIKDMIKELTRQLATINKEIPEVEKYLNIKGDMNNENTKNVFLPGVTDIVRISRFDLPDILGFTKSNSKTEEYREFLLNMVKSILDVDYANLKYESENYNPENKTGIIYYLPIFVELLKQLKSGKIEFENIGKKIQIKNDSKSKKKGNNKGKSKEQKRKKRKRGGGNNNSRFSELSKVLKKSFDHKNSKEKKNNQKSKKTTDDYKNNIKLLIRLMGNQLSYEDLFDNITKGVASNTKIEHRENKEINTEIKYKIYFKDIISGKQQEIKGSIQNDNGPSNEEVIQKKLEKYYKDTLTFDKLPSILSQPKDIEKIKIKVATGILIYLKSIKKNIESLLKWLETKRKNKKSNNNISEEEKNKLNVLLEKLNEKLKTAEELGQKEIIEELEKLKEKIEKKLNISKNKSKQNINN